MSNASRPDSAPPSFQGELELALPTAPLAPLSLELDTALPSADARPAQAPPAAEGDLPAPNLAPLSFDLADDPARPEPPPSKRGAAAPPSSPGASPAEQSDPLAPLDPSLGEIPDPRPSQRDRLQAAAQVAAAKASQAAQIAAAKASSAAKHVATKALEVDERHRIVLEDPSTWWRPMLGPIVGIAASLLLSVVAVVANNVSSRSGNTNPLDLRLPSLLIFFVAVAFAVYRWKKLQERDEE
jgi:hypothetical protein